MGLFLLLILGQQVFQVSPELGAQVRTAEGEFHGGFQVAQLIAGIVSFPGEVVGIHIAVVGHDTEGIGELDFSAFAGLCLFQHFEDIRRNDVAAQGSEAAGGFFDGGLFNHVLHLEEVRIIGFDTIHDTVGGNLVFPDNLAADDGAAGLFILVHELPECRLSTGIVHHIIPEDDAEGFAVDEILGAEDGIAQTPHVLLPGVVDLYGSYLPHFSEEVHLARFIEVLFQLRRGIEMVFNGPLCMAGDDENLFNAAGLDFFYNILNGRFIYNRKHFLRHGLRFRKEPGAKACSRNDCFSDSFHVRLLDDVLIISSGWGGAPGERMVRKGCGSGVAALARPGGGLASLTLANLVGRCA